jgi:hypothetical protein
LLKIDTHDLRSQKKRWEWRKMMELDSKRWRALGKRCIHQTKRAFPVMSVSRQLAKKIEVIGLFTESLCLYLQTINILLHHPKFLK